jgi:hypothetical protein
VLFEEPAEASNWLRSVFGRMTALRHIAAAATASIAHLKTSGAERAGQRRAVTATKAALQKAGLP